MGVWHVNESMSTRGLDSSVYCIHFCVVLESPVGQPCNRNVQKSDQVYVYERVKNVSEKLWYFQRYTVITDYSHRIPSPFNLILRPIIWICSSKEYCSCKVNSLKDTERERRKKDALQSFQKIVALRYCNKQWDCCIEYCMQYLTRIIIQI